MISAFQKHCSDESLIAHLDGELRFYRRNRVRKHVAACWQCRLRLSEIEEQILGVTRAMEDDPFPGPDRVAAARIEFLERADAIAREMEAPPPARQWRWTIPAAACAAVAVLAVIGSLSRRDTRAEAVAAMYRVEVVEAQAARESAHQRLRVVARQLRPVAASRQGELELWSEPGSGRFSSRFRDSAGALRLALWQPAPDRRYVYHARRGATAVRISRREAKERWNEFLFRPGLTLEDLESGLLDWLEQRPWRPVSLSSGISFLASSDGTELNAAEVRSPSGQRLLRLTARKTAAGLSVEFSLDLDRATYTPRLQRIRYESPQRVLELELYSEPASRAMPAVFEPPASLREDQPVPAPAPAPPVQIAPDPATRDVEIHFALHQAHACRGETIEIDRRPGGAFQVRGVVGSTERKQELNAALAPLAGASVSMDIKSAQEALRDIPPEAAAPFQNQALPSRSGRDAAVRSLARFFGGSVTQAEQFADKALSDGEDLMRDAQALRRLAERFPQAADLPPASRRLLDRMEEDHLRDLRSAVDSLRRYLQPVLGAQTTANALPAVPAGSPLLQVFQSARTLNERLRRLFDGDSGIPEERLIRELAEGFPTLDASLAAAAAPAP